MVGAKPGISWICTLTGSGSTMFSTPAQSAETVRIFLDARTDYPAPLRSKILQASDVVERSASIVYGWSG